MNIITKASDTTLDRLVEDCVASMELYLTDLAAYCADRKDFSLYEHVTGHAAPIATAADTMPGGTIIDRDDGSSKPTFIPEEHFNDSVEMTVPIPDLDAVKKTGVSYETFLKQYLVNVIRSKASHPRGPIANRFDYSRYFTKDTRGRVTKPTPEGKGVILQLAQNVAEQIIPYMMAQENQGKGQLFSAKLKISGSNLHGFELKPIILDPEHYISISNWLPDTKGRSNTEREEMYEQKARPLAVAAMARNMVANPRFKDYFREIEIDVGGKKTRTYTLSDKMVAELDNDSVASATAKDSDILQLVRLYDKLTDRITEAMLGLEEQEAVPFYLEFAVDASKGTDGLQDPVVREAKNVYVSHNAKTDPLIINVPKVEGAALEKADLKVVARDIVHKVISYVIAPRMKAINHPKLWTCFLPNTDPEFRCNYLLTEQGAGILEDMIKDIAGEVAIRTMMMRETLPEHFKGYRARGQYTIGQDGLMEKVEPVVEYFAPTQNQFPYRINPLTLQLGAEKPETFERLGKDVVVEIMSNNMSATRHPAYDAYFANEDGENGKTILTEAGASVLGEIVEKNAKQIAAELSKLSKNNGSNYMIAYKLGIADADFHIAYNPGTDDPRVKALMGEAGFVPQSR